MNLALDSQTSIFGVYDGHGGSEISEYVSRKLPGLILNNRNYSSNLAYAMFEAYWLLDIEMANN